MAIFQMLRERPHEISVILAGRGQLIRFNQIVLLVFLPLPTSQHLLEHRQARLLFLELIHHFESATKAELG